MTPEVEFYLKLFVTFLLSGLIFVVMMKMQAKKEKEADRRFRELLRSKGMDPDLKE